MASSLAGMSGMHVELTNHCNKNCWMCECRKLEKERSALSFAAEDTDFALLEKLATELPPGLIIQLHNKGEPLMYPRFGDAARMFHDKGHLVNLVTNGKLLVKKAAEIIDAIDSMAVSIFENDSESEEQYATLTEFLRIKGDKKPLTFLRIIGRVDETRYQKLNAPMVRREIRQPEGVLQSEFKSVHPIIPEIGVCLDFLTHPVMNTKGDISICSHIDPLGMGILGNLRKQSLIEIWNGEKRSKWREAHIAGRRSEVPLCATCNYWGIPSA